MKQIIITFTPEDVKNAGPYTDNEHCLIATALKRMGYKRVDAGPRIIALRDDGGRTDYEINANPMDVVDFYHIPANPLEAPTQVRKDAAGKTVTLTQV